MPNRRKEKNKQYQLHLIRISIQLDKTSLVNMCNMYIISIMIFKLNYSLNKQTKTHAMQKKNSDSIKERKKEREIVRKSMTKRRTDRKE